MKDLMPGWKAFPIRKKARKLWLEALPHLFWAIWKERNKFFLKMLRFPLIAEVFLHLFSRFLVLG